MGSEEWGLGSKWGGAWGVCGWGKESEGVGHGSGGIGQG